MLISFGLQQGCDNSMRLESMQTMNAQTMNVNIRCRREGHFSWFGGRFSWFWACVLRSSCVQAEAFGLPRIQVVCFTFSALSGQTQDIPLYRAMPFQDSIAKRASHPFPYFQVVSLRYPSGNGGFCTSTSHAGGGIAPNLFILRHPKPISRDRGYA